MGGGQYLVTFIEQLQISEGWGQWVGLWLEGLSHSEVESGGVYLFSSKLVRGGISGWGLGWSFIQ